MSENKIVRVVQSRKFWMAAVGLALILVTAWGQDPYPTDAVVTGIMGVISVFIGATAWEDGKHAEAAGQIGAANATQPASAVGIGTDTPTVIVQGEK